MRVKVKVEGLKELEQQLNKLEAKTAHKALNGALMNASLPIVKRAKAGAPVDTGKLQKAIGRISHRSNKTLKTSKFGREAGGNAAAGVSVVVRYKKAPHGHIIHDGTKTRKTKGKGRRRPYRNANRGRVTAQPFMSEAWESEGGQKAIDRFKNALAKQIKRLAK